jgi:hypothetical protein
MKMTLRPAMFTLSLLPMLAGAQVNPAFSDLAEATEQARTIIATDRKLIVSQALALSGAQSNAFWPIYDRYMAELKQAGDLRVKVITDYAANYDSMSDEVAKQLVADGLKYQEKVVDIRRKYVSKFRKAIPDTKLARFYQVENKLDAITDFALARQIPLVPQSNPAQSIAQP